MATQQEAIKIFGESLEEANLIKGTSNNDVLAVFSDNILVNSGGGNDTIEVYGAQNVTIETGEGKDEIYFPFEGYDNPSVTFTDFDPQNDILNFPEWAFFYEIYHFRASVKNGNLILQDGAGWYTLTFNGVTSTDTIKNIRVKKWDGYSTTLGNILYNTISSSDPDKIIDFEIPNDALYYNGQSYYIYANVASTWEEAQAYCQSLGGHLAVINDSAENTALFNYMKSKGYNSAYFGLSDAATEGTWQWVDGSSVTYTNWASGEPNGSRSENYGMFYKGFNNSKWNDGDFSYDVKQHTANFICEWTPIQSTEIADDAFEYNGHSYYLYSGVATTWEEAQAYCQSLGGHLAVINDSAENTTLFNYMKSKGYNSAYFGLSDAVTEGNWQWVDGSSVTYTNWASGEPNSERSNEDYAEFYYKFTDGKWNDGNFKQGTVGDSNVFICEWDTVREDDENEIGSATTLEVINLFQNMDAAEKKTTLKENFETLESLKTIVEGDKKVEIVNEETGETIFTDIANFFQLVGSFYNDDTPIWFGELTKYARDKNFHIKYQFHYLRGLDGNYALDRNGNKIKVFDVDANGDKIKIENTHREAFNSGLGALFDISSIIDLGIQISSGKLTATEVANKATDISAHVASVTSNISELTGRFKKAGLIGSLAAPVLSTVASVISLTDGVEPNEIVELVSNALQTANNTIRQFSTSTLLENTKFAKWLKEQPLGQKLSANTLKANLFVAGAVGIITGGIQYFESAEKYQIDGLKDSQAIKDKWTDAFSAGLKGFYGTATFGLDDIAFEFLTARATNLVYGVEWFWTWITGGDVSKVKKMSTGGKNYMELFGDFVKLVFLNQYTDPQGDKDGYMENTKVGRNIYSGGGNDSINNKASKANIYSGTGNDIIFCSEGTNQQYIDGGNDNDHIALYGSSNEIHGGLGDDQIDIFGDSKNPAGGNYILGEAGNDYIYVGDGKSKKKSSIANSIDGGAGEDIIFIDQTKTSNIIFYNNGDGNDEIFGYDSNDQIRINKSDYTTQFDGDDVKIIVGSGSMTLYDAKDKKLNITRTDIDIMPTGMTADKKKTTLTLSNKFKMQEVYLENYDKSFTKVNASGLAKTQPVAINGNSSDNSIKGGKGNDTLSGGSGNDTETGGAGEDIFIYSGGNDLITDYKSGEDKIKMGTITSSTVKGSDVIVTTPKGTLTVKGIKSNVVTFIDDNGKTTDKIFFADTSYSPLATGLTYDSKRTVLNVSNKFSDSTINLDEHLATVTKVNCSTFSKSVNIIGNSSANSLKGGKGADYISGGNDADTLLGGSGNDKLYGGTGNDILKGDSGNDSLYGGSGDDILTGGTGNDWFIYEGGHDVITDYKAGEDNIKISGGKISKTSYNKKDVIFTIGSGSLTIKNGKGKKISVTDSSNKTQTYSKTLDLFYDNNFVTDELQLDDVSEVTANNYSVGHIQSSTNSPNFEMNSIVSALAFEKK